MSKITWNQRRGLVAIALVVILVGFGSFIALRPSHTLHVAGKTYHLLIPSTPAEQEKGLGDRSSLPTNEGMLFIFPNTDIHCFWMKDMHFSLDMVWLNDRKQIVHIQHDVLPSTYPATFCPNTPAKYVLELNAGQTQSVNLQIGQKLNF